MERYSTISLIDRNPDRRSRCFTALQLSKFHIEPYESAIEFLTRCPTDTLILACDEDRTLVDLLASVRDQNNWSPIIGYGKPLNPVRCSQLFLQGLVGYLAVPFNHEDLEA